MTLKSFQQMLNSGTGYVVLDTETTGLHSGEICQIALMSSNGEILLDTLVKTINPIPRDATRIHGITDEMVKDSPRWADIQANLVNTLYRDKPGSF